MKFESNLDYRELKECIIERVTLTNIRHKLDGFMQKLPVNLDLMVTRYAYQILVVLKDKKLAKKFADIDDIYVDNIRYYRAFMEMPPRAVDDEFEFYITYYSYDLFD